MPHDHIDTREGWRETTGEKEPYRDQHALIEHDEFGRVLRSWVAIVIRPLPTEPGTVIRVTWDDGDSRSLQLLLPEGQWNHVGYPIVRQPEELAGLITDYEVVAEPQSVTAAAVLQRIRDWYTPMDRASRQRVAEIAREFRVQP